MNRRAVLGLGGTALLSSITACGNTEEKASADWATAAIRLGFSQVGAEGGWRAANTQSIKESAANSNVDLTFSDGQGKQENQIAAIRSFIDQKVDVIAFSPIVETGWSEVLGLARAAKIPVVLTDRLIDPPDDTLYRSSVGADFISEGNQAALYLLQEFQNVRRTVTVVVLEGVADAAPTKQRAQGFREILEKQPRFEVVDSLSGQWTRAGGATAMRTLVKRHDRIDAVFAQNDDMGLGAADVLERDGRQPGTDVKLVTVDGTRAALTALAAGRLNYVVECSPVIGPLLMDVVVNIYLGGTVPRRVLSKTVGFDREGARKALPKRVY